MTGFGTSREAAPAPPVGPDFASGRGWPKGSATASGELRPCDESEPASRREATQGRPFDRLGAGFLSPPPIRSRMAEFLH